MITREAHIIASGSGRQAVLIRGHNIPDDELDRIAEEQIGPLAEGEWWRTEERHFVTQKRVIWCERYGQACDFNGEDWHTHWHAVKPGQGDDTHWTEVWKERDRG